MSRTRNYACIVYPESAPEDWIDILDALHVPAFVSPLHDKDDKKPHYHVLFMYQSVKSVPQAVNDFKLFGGVGCECVKSLSAYARYLCHLDSPNKPAYRPEDVRCFSGALYDRIASSSSDKHALLKDVLSYIRREHIISFAHLVDITLDVHPEWFDTVLAYTVFIKEYQKSLTWSIDKKYAFEYNVFNRKEV